MANEVEIVPVVDDPASMEREEQRKCAGEERAQALAREGAARVRARFEALVRELLEAASDAILQIDGNDRIVLLNAAAERLFGYSRAELLGRSSSLLVPERCRDTYARLRAQCLVVPGAPAVGPEQLSIRRKNAEELRCSSPAGINWMWLSTGPSRLPQADIAFIAMLLHPAADGLTGHMEPTGNLGLVQVAIEKSSAWRQRFSSAFEITFHSRSVAHMSVGPNMSLYYANVHKSRRRADAA